MLLLYGKWITEGSGGRELLCGWRSVLEESRETIIWGGTSLLTVDGATPVLAACTSRGCCAGSRWWGGGQLTPKRAGTFCLSIDPRMAYVPSATCIFLLFTFLTLIFTSDNLGKNASLCFGRAGLRMVYPGLCASVGLALEIISRKIGALQED